jgi:hypothetical protein
MAKPQKASDAPSPEEWRRLYELAAQVKQLAPWKWMEEADLFGVKNPETGELGFVSVMGMAGEHYAVSLYRGAEGLEGFWQMEEGGMEAAPHRLLEIPQLQASFEDRDALDKQDREVIKKLGLKYRGAQSWPLFRSFRPGFMPWFLTAAEARFLAHALEQTLAVAPRVEENPDILFGEEINEAGETDEAAGEDDIYLVRVPREEKGALIWEDRMAPAPQPEPGEIRPLNDIGALTELSQLPQGAYELEVELLPLPSPVAEKRGERPYLPYLLMLAESRSRAIIGFKMLRPDPSLKLMYTTIPTELTEALLQLKARPKSVSVRSELLHYLLTPTADVLHCPLRLSDRLPAVEAAMDGLSQMMGLGQGF